MYTVMISDDGMFTAEFVQPPALSIPLGISGSTVEVRRNEDLTFSAMIGGEWVVVTAETTVTAANGNVYAAQLVNGVPIGVMHVAAMQEVMLGELGGTVTVKQAEDMTWWIGEMEVKDGTVYTAANGNMYALMMDSEGMWSAMYRKVMVTVALGTQGSVELVRAEDMSWWLGSEGVGVGSEVMSDSGKTYTLWYTDGVWTARFEPVSMQIAGTGLTAMTREADDMYDVNGTTLPASGVGDITVDGAMYHVWKDDGMLAGARFDAAQKDGRYNIAVGDPVLSAQDDSVVLAARGIEAGTKTVANELNAYLKVGGQAFSLDALLGTGMASRVGSGQTTVVSDALGEIRDLRQKAVATLDVFDAGDAGLSSSLTRLWTSVQSQVNLIFGDKVTLPTNRRDDRILDDFDDIIDALSDGDAFAAATASGGGGVFEDAGLSAAAAATAFEAEKVEATATFGAVGNTRFGAFWKKERGNAISKLADPAANALGAFAYGTTATLKTLRTRHVRQGTGNAFYAGRTEAVDGKGNFFSGDIEVQVRFAAELVNAVITNLAGETGAWEYLYGNTDVAEIILPDTRLAGNASWSGSGNNATVVYSTRAGVPRPIEAPYSFGGQLLGRNAGDQGNEASGVWSLGSSGDGTNYLAGGFGAIRGADLPDIRPEPDAGEGSQTKILSNGDIRRDINATEQAAIETAISTALDGLAADATEGAREDVRRTALDSALDTIVSADSTADRFSYDGSDGKDTRGQTIAEGMLTIIGRQYGADAMPSVDTDPDPGEDSTGTDLTTNTVNQAKYRTHKIDLAAALDGGLKWANGGKHVDIAKAAIEKQLRILESDIGLAASVKSAAWTAVRNAIANSLFNEAVADLPGLLGSDYSASRNDDFVRAAAEALEALGSNGALKAALGDGGVFDDLASDAQATVDGLWGRRNSRVQYAVGSTDFTRFGAWRRLTSKNAETGYGSGTRTEASEGDGPGSLAYSQLAATRYQGLTDPRYPNGARMTYEGSTIAVLSHQRGPAFFEGSVDIEVLWGSAAGANDTLGNADDVIGASLSMRISDLENMATAAPLYLDVNTTTHVEADLEEVVSIGIINVDVNDMLEIAANTTDSVVTVSSVEAGAVATRDTSWVAAGSVAADAVDGQFVGLGVSGPLAVLGSWMLSNAGTVGGNAAAIGARVEGKAVNGTVNRVSVTGMNFAPNADDATAGTFSAATIHGGFGAELP